MNRKGNQITSKSSQIATEPRGRDLVQRPAGGN